MKNRFFWSVFNVTTTAMFIVIGNVVIPIIKIKPKRENVKVEKSVLIRRN